MVDALHFNLPNGTNVRFDGFFVVLTFRLPPKLFAAPRDTVQVVIFVGTDHFFRQLSAVWNFNPQRGSPPKLVFCVRNGSGLPLVVLQRSCGGKNEAKQRETAGIRCRFALFLLCFLFAFWSGVAQDLRKITSRGSVTLP